MTVKELIAELQKFENQDLLVVVDGYEGGLDDITKVKRVKMLKNFNTGRKGDVFYWGIHEEIDDRTDYDRSNERVDAVYLPR